MSENWIAERTKCFDASGVRKIFDLAANLTDRIDLSIGQPDYDVPKEVRRAAIEAIESGKNGYALSQGMPVLREKLQAKVDAEYGHDDRQVFVTCGTSGGLVLGLLALVDPGDEVIVFDPCFMMYDALAGVFGAKIVRIDTYPDFEIDLNRVASAITPRTKAIVVNSPANPTGAVASGEVIRGLAELAAERDVALISDEIYREFCYDGPFVSPAKFNARTLVVDGFSKTYGMPGWRLGFAHGPKAVVAEMLKLQQFSFVCAPHPFQWAGAVAMDTDVSGHVEAYHRKRDAIIDGLSDAYELVRPGGAFYAFPKAPWGTATEFVTTAVKEHRLLLVPGGAFGRRDTHFRISYAVSDEVISRGIDALRKMAADR